MRQVCKTAFGLMLGSALCIGIAAQTIPSANSSIKRPFTLGGFFSEIKNQLAVFSTSSHASIQEEDIERTYCDLISTQNDRTALLSVLEQTISDVKGGGTIDQQGIRTKVAQLYGRLNSLSDDLTRIGVPLSIAAPDAQSASEKYSTSNKAAVTKSLLDAHYYHLRDLENLKGVLDHNTPTLNDAVQKFRNFVASAYPESATWTCQ